MAKKTAKKAGKKTAKKKAGRRGKPKMDFHGQMVLFRWALAKFGVETLKEFSDRFDLKPETTERSRTRDDDREGEGSVFFQKMKPSICVGFDC